jgi:hypothetical protein
MARMTRSDAISVVPEARAAKTSFAPKDDVFGISVDPHAFQDIRATLQAGRRPAASSVDVEALVNYFAGAPARRPRRGLALDVEASPAVIEAEGDHALLRFTVDAPAADPSAGSIPPVASDVRVEVVFNDDVVSKATRIGGAGPLGRESVLLYGTSVTGLYALELQTPVGETQLLATVRLHSTSVSNGKPETITRHIRGRDLTRSWQKASRRHRLASLGAVWGEKMRGNAPGFDLARRAEELATQNPGDARAKELAAAASADGGR